MARCSDLVVVLARVDDVDKEQLSFHLDRYQPPHDVLLPLRVLVPLRVHALELANPLRLEHPSVERNPERSVLRVSISLSPSRSRWPRARPGLIRDPVY